MVRGRMGERPLPPLARGGRGGRVKWFARPQFSVRRNDDVVNAQYCIFWACLVLVGLAPLRAVRGDDNWPMFRGPLGTGVAEGDQLPDRWSATENVAWKAEIPGRGWSSPIVWGKRVFLTTVVNTGKTP